MTTKIDEVEIEYRLEQLLPTAGSGTIERVVDLLRWQISLHLIDAQKNFAEKEKVYIETHDLNRRNHKILSVIARGACLLVGALAMYVIHLKGGF